jgi:hypothetical protein
MKRQNSENSIPVLLWHQSKFDSKIEVFAENGR